MNKASSLEIINYASLSLFNKHYIELNEEEELTQARIEEIVFSRHYGEDMSLSRYGELLKETYDKVSL